MLSPRPLPFSVFVEKKGSKRVENQIGERFPEIGGVSQHERNGAVLDGHVVADALGLRLIVPPTPGHLDHVARQGLQVHRLAGRARALAREILDAPDGACAVLGRLHDDVEGPPDLRHRGRLQ